MTTFSNTPQKPYKISARNEDNYLNVSYTGTNSKLNCHQPICQMIIY